MSEQAQKQVFPIRTTLQAIERFKAMANEQYHDYGDEFMLIINAEWERRQSERVLHAETAKRKVA